MSLPRIDSARVARLAGMTRRLRGQRRFCLCRLLDEAATRLEWAYYDEHGQRHGGIDRGDAEQLRADLRVRPASLSLIVPGRWVRADTVHLPLTSRRQRRQALPFAVEESLLSELEQVHIVDSSIATDAPGHFLVVDKNRIDVWAGVFAHLPVAAIFPDHALLPPASENVLRQVGAGQWLWAGADGSRMAVEEGMLPAVLLHSLTAEQRVRIQQRGVALETVENLVAAHEGLVIESVSSELLDDLAPQVATSGNIDLRQGAYARIGSTRTVQYGHGLVVLAASVLIMAAPLAARAWNLERQSERLQALSEKRYREWFPADKRVVNIPVQVANHLSERVAAPLAVDPLPLIAAVGAAIDGLGLAQRFAVQSLVFDAGKHQLQTELVLDSMPQLEQAKAALQRLGYLARVETASVEQGGKVRAVVMVGVTHEG